MAGLRQGRPDHESAERLGCRQARRAAGRGAVLDARIPRGPEGAFRTVPAVLLVALEFLKEQGSRQEPARPPVATRLDREDGCRERRLRSAGVRKAYDAQGLDGRRATKGHALPLPEPVQTPDAVDRGFARASQGRPADLLPGYIDQDVPALCSG